MKTILLGMNKPDPNDAFAPWKRGASGERLWKMMVEAAEIRGLHQVTKEEFLDGFERINVLDTDEWDLKEAIANREEIQEKIECRRVIVFGMQTLEAIGYPRATTWSCWYNTWYVSLPHPSGLTRNYNDPAFRDFVGMILYSEMFKN